MELESKRSLAGREDLERDPIQPKQEEEEGGEGERKEELKNLEGGWIDDGRRGGGGGGIFKGRKGKLGAGRWLGNPLADLVFTGLSFDVGGREREEGEEGREKVRG